MSWVSWKIICYLNRGAYVRVPLKNMLVHNIIMKMELFTSYLRNCCEHEDQ